MVIWHEGIAWRLRGRQRTMDDGRVVEKGGRWWEPSQFWWAWGPGLPNRGAFGMLQKDGKLLPLLPC